MAFQLDHVFVACAPSAPEMEAIEEAGFVPSHVNDHPGQGTASRGVFFENIYLELAWLTDADVARSPGIARTGLAQRADPGSGACPFGIGLRSPVDPVPAAPFEAWLYAPPYVPEGMAFQMASSSERVDEPLLFVLPMSRDASWTAPEHPCGARRVSRVSFESPATGTSPELDTFLELGLVEWSQGPRYLLRLEMDEGVQRRELDLRSTLPLVLEW